MNCRSCGKPIAKCQIGPPGQEPGCYFHTGHGWHRCDGIPENEATTPGAVAQPLEAAA